MSSPVLISWVAVNNDPYEREGVGGSYRLADGAPVLGPTLTLLFDRESPYAGKIRDIVLLHRESERDGSARERRAVKETKAEIERLERGISIWDVAWPSEDPTDHRGIFAFLRAKIPELRRRFAGRELIVHISPGTPSMQTVWVLMGETGFIDPPFTLVKSYRRSERQGRSAVVDVEIGIDTFYKAYRASRPARVASVEQAVIWDPALFRSEKMRRVFREARRFAHLNVPVLLLGERGTGKTTLAGWIRLNSPFRKASLDSSWPAVACGQYSPETMRAELFGYRKGAFTGALSDKPGLLAAADGDTLFLDEIGDVSRDLQRLLIKALEEKTYLALGDDRTRRSDFRLLAATNAEIGVLRSRLDLDFLDRISPFRVTVPPLREIREELPWLWERVYILAGRRSGVDERTARMTTDAHRRVVDQLARHSLPGNLRDLFRVAYRTLAARCDPLVPASADDATEYGLLGLEHEGIPDDSQEDVSRAVARAFADGRPLDDIVADIGQVPTKSIERNLKAFLAGEIRRIAKSKGRSSAELCDVSERSIREWASDAAGQSAVRRKKSSGQVAWERRGR